MAIPERDVLHEVDMKARRAQHHLDALDFQIKQWLKSPKNQSVSEHTDFEEGLHVFRVDINPIPEVIPMLLGDFVCCLRSSLEQLAWGLAHTDRVRTFTEREKRNISFLIFRQRDSTYEERRCLFPSAVAKVFDNLQPYLRGNAYRDDTLWQLNELWNMDKHRMIPGNCTETRLAVPSGAPDNWESYVRNFDDHLEVHFPLALYATSKVHLKPCAIIEILFGEPMGQFAVSIADLRQINDFVRNDVVPRFAGFFP